MIARSGAANEALGRLTPEVVDKLHEQRLFRMLLPRAYGGEEVDLVTWFRAMEALAKLDGSTAWCVGQINGCAASSSALDPAVARKIWGEPRSALSWGPPIKSRADEVDGGHRLERRVGILERQPARDLDRPDGAGLRQERRARPAARGHGLPHLPGAGRRRSSGSTTGTSLGLNATNSGGFKVNDLFVPQGYSIDRDHLREVQARRARSTSFRSTASSRSASPPSRSASRARCWTRRSRSPWRRRRGWPRRRCTQNHHVQFQIGEAEARLRSARNYVETTAGQTYDAVVASGKLTIAQRMDMRMAATFAIHEAKAVADAAWEVAGANAIFASGPFERRMRDLRTLLQQAQGRRAHLQDIGAFLMGLDANLAFA